MARILKFEDGEPLDTPAYRAERLSISLSMDANCVAKECELTPELYEGQQEYLLQASFAICKALDALNMLKHKRAMVRYEVRE